MGDFPGPPSQWRKSSHSATGNDTCVELADLGQTVGIRDSKNPDAPALTITRNALASLLTDIKNG
jgi:hypothetical protein